MYYIIYFKYKDFFEIDNRIFLNFKDALREATVLGMAFDRDGLVEIKFYKELHRHVFAGRNIDVYIMELIENSLPRI